MSTHAPRAGASEEPAAYEDLLPVMGERLGTAGLLAELRAGFRLLADPARGAITPESLRRGAAAALGVAGMAPAEADAMVLEGDARGRGRCAQRGRVLRPHGAAQPWDHGRRRGLAR